MLEALRRFSSGWVPIRRQQPATGARTSRPPPGPYALARPCAGTLPYAQAVACRRAQARARPPPLLLSMHVAQQPRRGALSLFSQCQIKITKLEICQKYVAEKRGIALEIAGGKIDVHDKSHREGQHAYPQPTHTSPSQSGLFDDQFGQFMQKFHDNQQVFEQTFTQQQQELEQSFVKTDLLITQLMEIRRRQGSQSPYQPIDNHEHHCVDCDPQFDSQIPSTTSQSNMIVDIPTWKIRDNINGSNQEEMSATENQSIVLAQLETDHQEDSIHNVIFEENSSELVEFKLGGEEKECHPDVGPEFDVTLFQVGDKEEVFDVPLSFDEASVQPPSCDHQNGSSSSLPRAPAPAGPRRAPARLPARARVRWPTPRPPHAPSPRPALVHDFACA
ncbi:hypothetical protein Taro_001545, partial [Colocasia esculenta]|nr:hypothetical protein [Colocasia esculenta]